MSQAPLNASDTQLKNQRDMLPALWAYVFIDGWNTTEWTDKNSVQINNIYIYHRLHIVFIGC